MAIFPGTDANDNFVGTGEDDILTGLAGNDTLSGGPAGFGGGGFGNDSLDGGDGNDTLLPGSNNDTVKGGAGDDRIITGLGNFDVFGEDGDDSITATGGNGTFRGEAGNDTIEIRVAGIPANSIVDGGIGNDRITARGRQGIELLLGGDGNDSLQAGDNNDTLFGGAGNDTLNGGNGIDILRAADVGIGERDVMSGSFESDTFQLYNGLTVLYDDGNNSSAGLEDFVNITDFSRSQFAAQRDKIEVIGKAEDYVISNSPIAGIRGDAIFLDTNKNQQFDRTSDELIAVVQGVNDLTLNDLTVINTPVNTGTNGNNNFVGLAGRSGIFNVKGGNDFVNAKDGNDLVLGGNGNDKLLGGSGNDTLLGEQGNDTLLGGSGDDILNGGLGSDTVDGGAGRDVYILGAGQGTDVISFRDGEDRLALEGVSFEQLAINQEGSNTVISVGSGGERLAVLSNIQASVITQDDLATIGSQFSQLANVAVPILR